MLSSPKICLITNRYPAHPDDVASPFVKDFHLGLKKKGVEVFVFTPYYETEKISPDENVIRFKWAGGEKVVGALNLFNPKETFQLFSFLKNGKRQLLERLEEIKPDSCLALWALPSGWFAYLAKKKLGIPYSVWCLGSDIYVWAKKPFLRGIIKKVLKEADFLFADGFDLKEKVEELCGKKCIFLPSMRKLPRTIDQTIGLDKSKTNFLYLGRWEKKKGLDELIKAFALVKKEMAQINLHILGWGDYERGMRKLINQLELKEDIKIVGKVSTSLVVAYLKESDCLMIPSKGDSIPLVFSEALQMRTPLIVTDVGDMGHLVKKFDLGKVVPCEDVQKLACAMKEFIKERKDYSKSIPEVLKFLNIEKAVGDYLETIWRYDRPPSAVGRPPQEIIAKNP
ncbi:MAG: glycosyltransferase [candidate division Zixibacteria bacterium]|nr:glycosyltransferase [candidate division Zixibacteria bacterium]